METKHEGGVNKHVELNTQLKQNSGEQTTEGTFSDVKKVHPVAQHDDTKTATEDSISGLKQHPEPKHDDCGKIIEGISSRLSNSSSSSSASDDSFNKSEKDGPQSPRSGCISSPDVSTQTPQWSMVSASPRGRSGNLSSTDVLPQTPEWAMFNSSQMKSPPIQAMGRGYDPNRIPSSIFSAKPATPMDWSVASNESLFSIHMGNNSFSKDSIFLQGLDFTKPEEGASSPLTQTSTSEAKSKELNSFTSNLPPVAEVAEKRSKNVYVREGLEDDLHETPIIVPVKKLAPDAEGVRLSTSSNLSDGRGVPHAEATSTPVRGPRVSNESAKSSDSFAFPVLLSDGGKGGSLKVNPEKPEATKPQPQDPEQAPEVASASWFSCVTCWPPRCC
ncbi:unnamed protein product [Coffea canephora]|uniref:Uncharacterized protein n=1 Tax=Coffea canephora TaxID=49390 RepID=A0A068U1B1_COFCA|nr:unnamed protein product [Coffea canephora]